MKNFDLPKIDIVNIEGIEFNNNEFLKITNLIKFNNLLSIQKTQINEILNSNIGSNCISLNNFKINEMLPIIANCNLYCGNDTGFMHISAALDLKTVALFIDSPVLAYGKYSKNINVIIPEGETEESTTHDTLGADKISFNKVSGFFKTSS